MDVVTLKNLAAEFESLTSGLKLRIEHRSLAPKDAEALQTLKSHAACYQRWAERAA
jgi:hypothetical protein